MNNKILLGDCLELMKTIPDKSIDAVICDLPYGTTNCHWDTIIPFIPLWEQYERICRGAIVLTASQPFSSLLVCSNVLNFKHEWIWVKNRGSNFANTKREPMKEHESVLVFAYDKWTYNMQMQERTGGGKDRVKYNVAFRSKSQNYRKFEGREANRMPVLRVPSSCQKFNTEVGLHPNQKPIKLIEYLVKTYTNPGDLVLDNACGSGTTGIACINLQRNYILMDKEQEHFDTANNRISAHLESMELQKSIFERV